MYLILYTALQSFEFTTNTKEQSVTVTPQDDISDPQTRKRPFSLEHPAPLKQLKQSKRGNVMSKTPTTDTAFGTYTQMDTAVQSLLYPEQQRNIKSKLVNIEFLIVKRKLQDILQSYDTKAMLEKCKKLMASDVNNIALFSSVQLQKFREYKHAPALIQEISPFCNWSNHSVLSEVIRACNNSDASNLLDQFVSQIDLSLPVTDYPIPQPSPNMIPYDTSSHTVLAVKLSTELINLSIQQVLDLQHLLQEKFQLSPHSFQLLAANSTPILYWTIPKCVVSVVTSNITDQRSFLHQNGIMEVSIYPGHIYATANTMRVGPLSFLNHYVDFEVINLYTLLYTINGTHHPCRQSNQNKMYFVLN